ncbi:LysE/ArgO family amino acid transporter [Oryzobacter terrae]|uniref:LysE/ArgO family amino acid transporter n=1 Tax=Oryzobacter terrae TaxID=1620385 RepID=UPI003671520E
MTTARLLSSALAGLGLGLGLIVAIGAQNAFVLRQGIRREHVLAVVLVCIASDAVLIAAGVAGAGALFSAAPSLVTAARWGGALFLAGYAFLAARRALRRPSADTEGLHVDVPSAPGPGTGRLAAVMGTTVALTWLNPHVYLDTFVLLGSIGSSHGETAWAFAAGAVVGSTVWFSALGVAARALAPVFARASAWRVLDGGIAVVMTCLAVGLLVGA